MFLPILLVPAQMVLNKINLIQEGDAPVKGGSLGNARTGEITLPLLNTMNLMFLQIGEHLRIGNEFNASFKPKRIMDYAKVRETCIK